MDQVLEARPSALEALEDLNNNNDCSAANKLQAFINAVEAQAGKEISADDAVVLIQLAQSIIDLLDC